MHKGKELNTPIEEVKAIHNKFGWLQLGRDHPRDLIDLETGKVFPMGLRQPVAHYGLCDGDYLILADADGRHVPSNHYDSMTETKVKVFDVKTREFVRQFRTKIFLNYN